MKFLTLAGELIEGDTAIDVLVQMRKHTLWIRQKDIGEYLEDFLAYLSDYYRVKFTTCDPYQVLEQLQDEGYLLRIY
ncbi:hypothetical protein [Telluribacter sp. SYSU D00476]|uniref:hypothetical protein n=1 Tax=Telluribacter sp. SYSU D00476 TaxID=2811430 RepID=UPI001FF5209C|nr:hypothetical protein [Telluribacter sp. SYSU D00476]